MATKKNKLKVFALGGLHEIGKNITVFEYGQDIIVVDSGIAFPENEMLGIDLVIPDFSYLISNKDRIRAIVLTHGHEDHIGSLPYLLRDVRCPIYGTKLTLGLLQIKFKEHKLDNIDCICVVPGETINIGAFKIEFIAVTHSIADSVGLAISCPAALVVHTGDFKIDHTPVNGEYIDLQRFAELGKKGVDLLLCDSTNVEVPGYTMSERSVGKVFENIFDHSENQRIMVATFASNIHRIQQVIDSAVKHNRKVCVIGRSMLNAVRISQELGYLRIEPKTLIDAGELKNYDDDKIAIVTTGSQGETMSALSRMAQNDHRQVEIKPGDKIIISASSIPGNEIAISRVVNELLKKGADVIYEGLMDIHVSGHAKREELKIMHALVKPKFFMPVHGEYRHLKMHRDLAIEMGMDKKDIFVMGIGDVLEVNRTSASITGIVPSGLVFVDGLGVGDVGSVVLNDRRLLSQDGLIIVVTTFNSVTHEVISGPDIISRGLVYVKESEDLMGAMQGIARGVIANVVSSGSYEWSHIKSVVRDELRSYVWHKTKRRPMILPIVMEADV